MKRTQKLHTRVILVDDICIPHLTTLVVVASSLIVVVVVVPRCSCSHCCCCPSLWSWVLRHTWVDVEVHGATECRRGGSGRSSSMKSWRPYLLKDMFSMKGIEIRKKKTYDVDVVVVAIHNP